MRKTKIICTLGPSTDKDGVLEELVKEGMNVARFNFSHGLHDEQKGRIDKLKEIRTRLNKPVAALLDTKGPEIRIREFENGKVTLKEGQEFTLTTEEIVGNEKIVSVTYKDLYKDVKPGNSILIDDGLIGLEVKKIKGQDIICKVVNGGVLGNKKGVNLPGVEVNMPFISPKDHDDILFGIKEGYDFIAASFTRTAAGKYPIEALKTMVKIARRTEADVEYNQQFSVRTKGDTTNVTTAISHATCMTAIDLNAKAIIAVTRSGNTARMVSKYRPGCQIIACTPNERTWRQLNMVWGVAPILTKEEYSMEILLLHATEAAEENGYVKKGDVVVLTVGVPLGRSGNTNLLKATVVGEY